MDFRTIKNFPNLVHQNLSCHQSVGIFRNANPLTTNLLRLRRERLILRVKETVDRLIKVETQQTTDFIGATSSKSVGRMCTIAEVRIYSMIPNEGRKNQSGKNKIVSSASVIK